MRPRHVPVRTCVGCQQERPKRQLVRIVRSPEGAVTVDQTGKAAGRGAYVCSEAPCWTVALRRGALSRALKTPVDAEDRAALEAYRDTLVSEATATGPS